MPLNSHGENYSEQEADYISVDNDSDGKMQVRITIYTYGENPDGGSYRYTNITVYKPKAQPTAWGISPVQAGGTYALNGSNKAPSPAVPLVKRLNKARNKK